MKVETHSVSDILAKNATSFFIPPFQRSYAWRKPELERFFNDLVKIVSSELDVNTHDKLEHFFGTIVVKQESHGFADKSVIIDGQQRLTTTLLFLIALRDLENDVAKKSFITNTYLTTPNSTFEYKIKLKQVTKDWDSYKDLVNQIPLNKKSLIKDAYDFFKHSIKYRSFKTDNYLIALKRINLAVIFLDERPHKGEDPQIIFETLNSIGRPLSLADLVRNYILLNMKSEEQSDVYDNIWQPKIEAVLNEHTSNFFRDFLQYKKSMFIKSVKDSNTKEIYHIFKDFVEKNYDITKKDFIDDIIRYVDWYNYIITEENQYTLPAEPQNKHIIRELIRNIFHDIGSEAFKPFVLGLLEYHQEGKQGIKLSDEKLIEILEGIRTYLIRRRIMDLTQGENKNIPLRCEKIRSLVKGEINIIQLLSSMFYDLRFPNDLEMTKRLTDMAFYKEVRAYAKFILGKMEEYESKVAVDFRNKQITIEHIMPQILDVLWQHELGNDYDNIHRTYLHNIGNLILTEFNSEMGNKPFNKKKEKLETSNLKYRLFLKSVNNWNENSILEHRKKMIDLFLETFPLPLKYKYKYQNNDSTNSEMMFSLFDDGISDLVRGKKPKRLFIQGEEYPVSNWRDVFIEIINFLRENNTDIFNSIMEDQDDIFETENVLVTAKELLSLIMKKPMLENRYKSLDTKRNYSSTNHIKPDELFIHVHASTETLIKRMQNIVNKYNLGEDFIMFEIY